MKDMNQPNEFQQYTIDNPPVAITLEEWNVGTIAWTVLWDIKSIGNGAWGSGLYENIASKVVLVLRSVIDGGFQNGVPGFIVLKDIRFDGPPEDSGSATYHDCYYNYKDRVYRTARDAVFGKILKIVHDNREKRRSITAMYEHFCRLDEELDSTDT